MCGILGIINDNDVNVKLAYGLMSLQHRGQDAAGVVTCEDNKLTVVKDVGLVRDIFTDENVSKLKGNMGVGQTRYSTVGSASKNNSHPLTINTAQKIAVVHNGNVTNYEFLKGELAKDGVFFGTTVDLEPIMHIFARHYDKTEDFLGSAEKVLNNVKGAYSITGVIAGRGLFAIRDKNGIRPLVMGRKGDSYIFTSETIVLQTLGYEFIRDVKPGEAILIDTDLNIENKILKQGKKAHCMFEWVYFARPESMIEERAVYKARLALGAILADKIRGEDIDVIIPVPDTARTCAIKVAEELGIKYREGLVKNRYIGRTFITPSQRARDYLVNIKLNFVTSVIKDKNVVVIDDSIVRGTTSKRIVAKLREAGAKKIIFMSSCPPIKYACYYGIDMSTEEELIASNKTIEEMREYIGADKLIYTTVEDLKKAVRRDLCTACLDSDYVVPVSKKEKKFFENDKQERC